MSFNLFDLILLPLEIVSSAVDVGESVVGHIHYLTTGNLHSCTPEQWLDSASSNPKQAAQNLLNTTSDPADWAIALADLPPNDRQAVAVYLKK